MGERKPLRHNRVREYAEQRRTMEVCARQLQAALIIDTARQIKSRYRRAATNRPLLTFAEWLLECGNLAATYSERFGYDDRAFRAQRLVREAARITLGTRAGRENELEWFIEGLQAQLDCEGVTVALEGIDFHGSALARTAESLFGSTLTLRFQKASEA